MTTDITKITRMAMLRSGALLAVKVAAYAVTGSASLLASTVDSIADVGASIVAHKSRRVEHAEQHHIALIQTIWISIAASIVLYETAMNMSAGVDAPILGVAILALTVLVDGTIVKKLTNPAPIVQGLKEDIQADITVSASALVALAAVYLTGMPIVDKIVAIVISVYLIAKGIKLTSENIIEASEDHALVEGAAKVDEDNTPYLP